ncbi:MAG: 3,4-dioxygenase subunit beta [Dehalococcoidia bacterium]
MSDHETHNDQHDRGLAYDLQTLLSRRGALRLFSMAVPGVALAAVVGCSSDEEDAVGTSTSTAATPAASAERTSTPPSVAGATATATPSPIPTTATPASACTDEVPEETAGPYPGDGSNGPNALIQSGIVRSDIRSSFGTSTTMAEGIPLDIALTIVDVANGCAPMPGATVYLWHCDSAGRYSMYSRGATQENYLRGVQAADADGVVRFRSVFPAAYSGRWPHIHFEVYPTLDQATSSANKLATSQLALPEEVCDAVYATAGYEQSVANMARTPLANDMVFADGVELQMATVTGDVTTGYEASLIVGV